MDDRAYIARFLEVYTVHDPADCSGRACTVHNPSDHPMRSWPLHWRSDRGIFERFCRHAGHPDPDQFAYWRETDQEWQAVHGCCGCCMKGNDD
ncbi:hypothetical protein [Tsukamurella tyrosinosolvens]|uniref:hypothetical protein n=1 Tax=Tsukamurella tyrosinosolvens TaxID=57704 RepID=UPI003461A23C